MNGAMGLIALPLQHLDAPVQYLEVTDLGNVPMANAFLHLGYRQFATRQIWLLTLEPDVAG